MLMPHRNRRKKTLQPQKAAASSCSLVEILKPKHPHKEQKQLPFISSSKNMSVLLEEVSTTSLQPNAGADAKKHAKAKPTGRR
jgi:hypothetical protein